MDDTMTSPKTRFSRPVHGRVLSDELRLSYADGVLDYAVRVEQKKAWLPVPENIRIYSMLGLLASGIVMIVLGFLGLVPASAVGPFAVFYLTGLAAWALSYREPRIQVMWNLLQVARLVDVLEHLQVLADTSDHDLTGVTAAAWAQVDLAASGRDTNIASVERQIRDLEHPPVAAIASSEMYRQSIPAPVPESWNQPTFAYPEPSNTTRGLPALRPAADPQARPLAQHYGPQFRSGCPSCDAVITDRQGDPRYCA